MFNWLLGTLELKWISTQLMNFKAFLIWYPPFWMFWADITVEKVISTVGVYWEGESGFYGASLGRRSLFLSREGSKMYRHQMIATRW